MPSTLTASDLRCDYRRDPLGIGIADPRLGWIVESPERSQRQSAFQVLVASSAEALARDVGDLWDSGRVESDDTAHVPYAGKTLESRQRCHWKVRVWDASGQPSPWSQPAWLETALLKPEDWRAQWIGIRPRGDDERLSLARSRWIAPAGEPAPAPSRVQFSHRFEIPAGAIATATLTFVCEGKKDPWNFQIPYLYVNGQTIDAWKWLWTMRAPARWDIAKQLVAGQNTLAMQCWFTPGAALIALIEIEMADGRIIEIATSPEWRTRLEPSEKDAPGWHETKDGWAPARDVGAFGSGPWPEDHIWNRMDKLVPAAYLRTAFTARARLARARIYATAAGIYLLRLNGQRVGDQELAPGITDYRKRIQYQAYDATDLVREGGNVLAAVVGDGWYSGYQFFGANVFGTEKGLLCQLHLDYEDGSSEIVISDTSWRGATGALCAADLFMGETRDATRELAGWEDGETVAAQWRETMRIQAPVGALVAQADEPVRATALIAARTLIEHRPGVLIFDLGQNLAGRARVRLRAPAGTRVVIRHGEMLAKDGSLYTENLRSARATDTYICRGGGEEVYEPSLTFHGFRYVEITGLPGAIAAEDVVGVVLNSDCPWSGSFTCSHPQLMQLQSNIRWGQRGNFISVPTDCPQRDERAGWTGDAQIFVRTATFNMDCAAFFHKYQQDMVDAQHANGAFPDFAPTNECTDTGHYGWGDAGVIVPWTIWRVYGDTRIIERHFAAMLKWVDHLTAKAAENHYGNWNFGDWVSPAPQTPNEVLAPIHHAFAARIVADMGEAIGRRQDAARMRAVFDGIKSAFAAKHVAADGRVTSDTQSAYILALRYGMLPEAQRPAAANHLVEAIERAGWHLHTGFLGTGHLLPALSEAGRDDVAFRLLLTDTFPSWLYTVKNGATTMWERWDSYTPESGPVNIGNMNSYNHYAFGAVGEWMYANIAGIDLAGPGFREIVIRPRSGGVLTHARGEFRSVRGTIVSAWRIVDGRFRLDVTIPANATAEVHVPARGDAKDILEDTKPASGAEGVRFLRHEPGAAVFAVGSGTYRFSAPA